MASENPTAQSLKAEAFKLNLSTLQTYCGDGRSIYTLTTYTRSMTDYVRVFVTSGDAIRELTFEVGQVCGIRRTDQGLAVRGCGFSKGLDVFLSICRAIDRPADQSTWREL